MSRKSRQGEYDRDFYAWTLHNAALIREGKLSEVDLKHVAEEIEDMGKSSRRELMSRLAILLAHLLKWKFQPERRGNSWRYTIKGQRFELNDLLDESPSLNHELNKQFDHAYTRALMMAIQETGLSREMFPEQPPFSLDETLSENFFPE